MMKYLIHSVILAATLAVPAAAQQFRADNDVIVVPTAEGFAVTSDAGLGARGYWCAAADYARDVLGAPSVARIYVAVARKPGLGQRSPVVFTLDPAGLTPTATLVLGTSLSRPGSNLAVGHAFGFCADGRLITNGQNR